MTMLEAAKAALKADPLAYALHELGSPYSRLKRDHFAIWDGDREILEIDRATVDQLVRLGAIEAGEYDHEGRAYHYRQPDLSERTVRPFRFDVLQDGWRDESVWLWGERGREVVLGAITREALEDDAEPVQRELNPDQLVTLATANVEAIGRVLNAKFGAGQAITPKPGDRPRVILRSGDLRAAGEKLSASALASPPFAWA